MQISSDSDEIIQLFVKLKFIKKKNMSMVCVGAAEQGNGRLSTYLFETLYDYYLKTVGYKTFRHVETL